MNTYIGFWPHELEELVYVCQIMALSFTHKPPKDLVLSPDVVYQTKSYAHGARATTERHADIIHLF